MCVCVLDYSDCVCVNDLQIERIQIVMRCALGVCKHKNVTYRIVDDEKGMSRQIKSLSHTFTFVQISDAIPTYNLRGSVKRSNQS